MSGERIVLGELLNTDAEIKAALDAEEARERQRDRAYWQPLKAELERLRHARRKL